MKPWYLLSTIGTLIILSTAVAPAFSFTGEVVTVQDGNTIEVLHNGKTERVRLQGIDCPDKSQPVGDKARQITMDLVFALEVTLEIHGKDKHGRVLADALLADGTNVNHTLVKDGWCRWSRKSAPKDTMLEQLETEAREEKRGVWADSDLVPLK